MEINQTPPHDACVTLEIELKKEIRLLTIERDRYKKEMFWHKIFILLMARCGASYRLCDDFIRYMTEDDSIKEFRFQGDYGFGGKLHHTNGRIYVSCYPEDSTAEIKISIDSVNREIEALQPNVEEKE